MNTLVLKISVKRPPRIQSRQMKICWIPEPSYSMSSWWSLESWEGATPKLCILKIYIYDICIYIYSYSYTKIGWSLSLENHQLFLLGGFLLSWIRPIFWSPGRQTWMIRERYFGVFQVGETNIIIIIIRPCAHAPIPLYYINTFGTWPVSTAQKRIWTATFSCFSLCDQWSKVKVNHR